MKKFLSNKKKLAISLSAGTVAAAAGISAAVVAANNNNEMMVNPTSLSVNFNVENNKVHTHKLIAEPVGYANSDLQLIVHDSNGNIVNDAVFTASGLPGGDFS
jgi:predicted PP-loop superfamily ATPase